jgi:hypothetical protein
VLKKGHAEIVLYNAQAEEVARCKIDRDKVDVVKDTKWCLNRGQAFNYKRGTLQKVIFGRPNFKQAFANGNPLDCRSKNVAQIKT